MPGVWNEAGTHQNRKSIKNQKEKVFLKFKKKTLITVFVMVKQHKYYFSKEFTTPSPARQKYSFSEKKCFIMTTSSIVSEAEVGKSINIETTIKNNQL